MKVRFLCFALALSSGLSAQKGQIKGRVYDEINNEPLPFANVVIEGTTTGTSTDVDGNYVLELEPGLYNVTASFVGYTNKTEYEVQVSRSRPIVINFALSESNQTLGEVSVTAQDRITRKDESPVSVSTLGINEIQRNPGGNQDISLVIQSLPGVASTPNFRNDIIIRGGAPNENSFFLDGIEIPSINHFSTQGSSGGPVGLLNVNFIREVDLYTSAFPVEKANALSSVLDIKLKDGRSDKIGGIFQVGASEVGLTLEGPLSEKTTFLASARRSYLQFLFSVLELPFLPTYNDFQVKIKHKFDEKNQLTFIGLGAIDQFKLNLDANETETQQFQLAFLPVNEQWNYSVGAKFTHFGEKSYTNFILSRFMLNNVAYKYEDNDEVNGQQLLDYQSQEIENKLRIENFRRSNGWRLTNGLGFEEIKYQTSEVDLRVPPEAEARNYETDLRLYQYYIFSNANRSFWDEKISLNLGLRLEGNSFNAKTANPLSQISPKVAFTYNINSELSFNANYSIYYQLPPYTSLGFRDTNYSLVNKDLTYISTQHMVAGFAYYLPFNAKISLEGFYKIYANYPFLTERGITLANLGSDFGVIGNEPAVSSSQGRAYGLEFLYQQKLYDGWFGTLAYTLVKSEFEDAAGNLVPSSWDNQNIITLTGGKKFGKNWEIGMQYQFLGGAPYTPTDIATSSLVQVYDLNRRGLPDWSRFNELRFDNFNRVNIRVDKKWFFESWSLNVYFDVQNLLGQAVDGEPLLALNRDAQGNPIILNPGAPANQQRYDTKLLENGNGTRIPSIGIIVQF
ncbi:TonB-dependent receptor [Croceimicrobium hydrocarbonivorans]|uniref:TonB-dependent receptor n=1 Tax=Croceimicrobium hydrocarbonivorans TaxID=2761580 RepID=A0A7H0VDA5_9FLAO|nr:TonB-dependent receptor [Croceimicrobium hydrocarbonivorans]QNR23703.1 TonB-dependent receptor [Croceimicrobium hydrocarbonivorans]